MKRLIPFILILTLFLSVDGIIGSGRVAITDGDPNNDLSVADKYPVAIRSDNWTLYKFDGSTFQPFVSNAADEGSVSTSPDGSGNISFSHSIGATPGTVVLTAKGTTFYHLQYLEASSNSSSITISVVDVTGAPVTTGTVSFSFIAYE